MIGTYLTAKDLNSGFGDLGCECGTLGCDCGMGAFDLFGLGTLGTVAILGAAAYFLFFRK